MEMGPFLQIVQQFGALGVLVALVWKFPAIIEKMTALIQSIIGHIRDSQKEALDLFKGEIDKMLSLFSDKFKHIEEKMVNAIQANTMNTSSVRILTDRMRKLEDGSGEHATPKLLLPTERLRDDDPVQ